MSDKNLFDLLEVIDPVSVYRCENFIKSAYKPEFPAMLMDFMAYGHTFAGACARLGLSLSSAYSYLKKIPEFAEAKEVGEQLRLFRLERVLNFKATGEVHPIDTDWKPASYIDLRATLFSMKTIHRDLYNETGYKEEENPNIEANKSKEVIENEIERELITLRRSLGKIAAKSKYEQSGKSKSSSRSQKESDS